VRLPVLPPNLGIFLRDSRNAGSFLGIGREIPNLFVLASSVVRFSPSFAAAPRGPPTIQPACSSASKIKALAESYKVIDEWKVWVRCRLGIISSVCFL
jgi:hypothetical protein